MTASCPHEKALGQRPCAVCVSSPDIDPYAWYDSAMNGVVGPCASDCPQTGWYRHRRLISPKGVTPKRYEWEAVAYWKDSKSGEQRCHINGKSPSDPLRMFEIWPFVYQHPISEETYHTFIQIGRWPETNEVLADLDRRSNEAPPDDSFEGVRDRIDALAAEAVRLIKGGPAKTKAQADAAADVAVRLGELFSLSDKLRKKEKQPHLDAGRDVDAKWNALRKEAEVYKDIKNSVVQPWLAAENARLKKIADDAERERLAAEAKAIPQEAHGAARETPSTGGVTAAATSHVVTQSAPPPSFAPAKAGTQKTVSSRVEYVAVIDDYALALAHFADHPDIKSVVQNLANKQAKAQMTVPGCRIVEHGKAV